MILMVLKELEKGSALYCVQHAHTLGKTFQKTGKMRLKINSKPEVQGHRQFLTNTLLGGSTASLLP